MLLQKTLTALTTIILLAAVVIFVRHPESSISQLRAAAEKEPEETAQKMVTAANQFLEGLSAEQQKKAQLTYDNPMRLIWHYYPRTAWQRSGVMLKELNGDQKKLFMNLVRAGTSADGYQTAVNLMQLEAILRDIENTDFARIFRDPERFYLTIFGTPGTIGRWSWKIEGHHLLLNYVIEDGQIVSGSPFVVGANPGRVPSGAHRGLRILPKQEDLGRRLFTSLSPSSRQKATIAEQPPFDVMTNADTVPKRLPEQGLSYAQMTGEQKQLIENILRVYTGLQPAAVEKSNLDRIREAGMDRIHFGWIGSPRPGRSHYYRVTGPTFVVEYCNTQNSGNHIHVVWRDYETDFGENFADSK